MIFAAGIVGLHNSTPHGEAGKGKHYGHHKNSVGQRLSKRPEGWRINGFEFAQGLRTSINPIIHLSAFQEFPYVGGDEHLQKWRQARRLSYVLGFELWLRLNYNHGVPDEFASPIDASTRMCAVYGFPIRHSASPAMQNAGIAALGLNWRYIACEVAPETLRAA
ncbi:MAG TPA: hypothetical protein VHC44_10470, partial [Verrucomicrobiae bacterium]|nr:hypothetical protein [Verrucomicrobiae bacterium]